MKQNNKISIVIPVYNSVESLERIISSIQKVFSQNKYNFEIIFVDDGSPNIKTWQTLVSLKDKYSNIIIIQLIRNFGQQGATLCGISKASGDYIITMDDDLQHDPKYIDLFMQNKDHDVVIATFQNKKVNFLKKITSSIKLYFDSIILNKPKNITLTSFRMINISVAKALLKIKSPFPIIGPMLCYITNDIINIDIGHNHRLIGKSGYNFFKRFKLFTNLLINNSSLLLRGIGLIGIFFALFSFFLALFFIIKKIFFNINTSGWTSLITTILFFSGVQLLSIGIIGEYLFRLIISSEEKPVFIERKVMKSKQ